MTETDMQVRVNGEMLSTPDGATVETLVCQLELARKGLAVERNRVIVPKSSYQDTPLSEGDEIEIVQFVGGG